MKVYDRKAVKPYTIVAQNGDRFDLEVGRTYTCGGNRSDGMVQVFTNYWVMVPIECLEPAQGEVSSPTADAEVAINRILADLEASTGQRVADLNVSRIEVTRMDDECRQFRCTVSIELERPVGQQWAT